MRPLYFISRHNAQKIDFLSESRRKLIFTYNIDFYDLITFQMKKISKFSNLVLFKYPKVAKKLIFRATQATGL